MSDIEILPWKEVDMDLPDRIEVADILSRYFASVDRGDWTTVRSCYHSDAFDNHGPYKGDVDGLIEFFTAAVQRLRVITHLPGVPRIEMGRDVAHTETRCLYHAMAPNASVDSLSYWVRYLDRFERREGNWAIADRRVVLDTVEAGTSAPPELAASGWLLGTNDATDPAVAFFAKVNEAHPLA